LAQVTESGSRNHTGSVVRLTISVLLLLVLLRRQTTVGSSMTADLGRAQLRSLLQAVLLESGLARSVLGLSVVLYSVVADFLKLDRLSVRDGRVSAVLGVIRRNLNHSFRKSIIVFKSRPFARVSSSMMVTSSVDVSLDALLMTTTEISSLVAQNIVAMVRDCSVLLNFGVRDWNGKVLFQSLVRVAYFTEDVYRLEVSSACTARISLQCTGLASLFRGT